MTVTVETVQELLDCGFKPNKIAKVLNVHHSTIDRIVKRYSLEYYIAFDEYECKTIEKFNPLEDTEGLDALDEVLRGIGTNLEGYYLDSEKDKTISKWMKDNNTDIKSYLSQNNYSFLMEFFYFKCVTCTDSESIKQIDDFYVDPTGQFGLERRCKSCKGKYLKKYFKEENVKIRLKEYQRNNWHKYKLHAKDSYHKRRAFKKSLPNETVSGDLKKIKAAFDNRCPISKLKNDLWLDHFIPLSWGHGGHYKENIVFMLSGLNISKNNKNPFKWFREEFGNDSEVYTQLVRYLSSLSSLTTHEYETFVNWCYANQRTVDEIKRDQRHSIEIFREATGLQFPLPKYALNASGRRSTDDTDDSQSVSDYGNSHGEVS